jgi:hypothetical protein
MEILAAVVDRDDDGNGRRFAGSGAEVVVGYARVRRRCPS